MKTIKSRFILAALAISVCASGAYAQAPTANAQPDHAQMADQMQKRMQERMNKHRTMMHDQLKITPEQEAAWKTFVDATSHNMKDMMGRRAEHKAGESMSAPAMMEKQIERSKEHLAMMQKHVEALKTFYAVLTPEQQKTFDHLHKRMHHRAKMMRMMGRDRHSDQHDMDHNMPKK